MRFFAVAAAIFMSLMSVTPVGAQTAEDVTDDAIVTLISTVSAEVPTGASTWIALSWTADLNAAASFQVRAVGDQGVEIAYPTNTNDHSSLYWDDQLNVAEIDYTAIRVRVPDGITAPIRLDVTLTYSTAAGAHTETFLVLVPVEGGGLDPTTEPDLTSSADNRAVVSISSDESVICDVVGTDKGENLQGTEGDDVICGFGGDDVINGLGGNDTIYAGSGDDKIYGSPGDDLIDGGPGNDVIHGYGGNDDLRGGTGNDSIYGGEGDDLLTGGDGNDKLDGEVGNDLINGGAGNDRLFGRAGDDTLNGDEGTDKAAGDEGTDFCSAEQVTSCEN